MEPWVVVILALLAVLILGGFSAAFLPALFRNRSAAGQGEDESLESNADRLYDLVNPSKDAADEKRLMRQIES